MVRRSKPNLPDSSGVPSVSKRQSSRPLFASSAYSVPSALPVYTRPFATAGEARTRPPVAKRQRIRPLLGSTAYTWPSPLPK